MRVCVRARVCVSVSVSVTQGMQTVVPKKALVVSLLQFCVCHILSNNGCVCV